MKKEEHIIYWLKNAESDLERAERCFRDQDYVFALFCLHLALEKTIKSVWIKYSSGNFPPWIHNLVKLITETPVQLENGQLIFLNDLNRFQLEGRYPDYTGRIYEECTKEYTMHLLNEGKRIQKWLVEIMQ